MVQSTSRLAVLGGLLLLGIQRSSAQISLPPIPPSLSIPTVSMFPVSTQTSFPSPKCSHGPSADQSLTVNYNFETVERAIPGLPLSTIGEYNLLYFDDIQWVNTDPDFDGNHLGIAPYSYPDVALLSQIGDPTISVGYMQSTISSFDAQSFWYGCVAPAVQTAGSLPVNCTITARGLNAAGITIAHQKFDFFANGSLVQNQLYGKFNPSFKGLQSLKFSFTSPISTTPLIDNFIATVHQKACSPYYSGSFNPGH